MIETARLRLRPFELGDAEAAHAWFGDAVVMRYMSRGPDASVEQTRERLAGYAAVQAQYGFSKWLVIERASGQPIGDAGLLVLPELPWIDLGYRLIPRCWGQGLATEAASAWVARARERGLERLGAFAHPDNRASLRVLQKLGFRGARRDTVMGMPAVCVELHVAAVGGPAG